MKTDRNKLTNMTDEVHQLHPLLNLLLPKIPNVVNVEYTHGTAEMGADFIVAVQEPGFDRIEYIGVIAKIGKILQDFTDIVRQIDELAVPRTYQNGKEKIRLGGAWVIATQTISKNAQEVIHEKYALRRIDFIDGSRLQKWIDQYMPIYWSELTLHVGEYLSALRQKNEETDHALSLWHIENKTFYVEQDLYDSPRSTYRKNSSTRQKHSKVNIFERIKTEQVILVEGGMGTGKSKLLRQIVEHYTVPEIYSAELILPVMTTYKELVDRFEGNVAKLLDSRLNEEVRRELKDVTFLVLIDALDEKNMPIDEEVDALSLLTKTIDDCPNTNAIITSRYLRGIDQAEDLNSSIARLELRPLSMQKTIEFVTKLCSQLNLANRIIEDLKKSALFKELPRTPIAAILLAKLLNENPKDLPSNMTELYSKYVELLLGRWDVEKGLQSQKEYQALDNIMILMSVNILDYERNSISLEEARDIFQEYLSSRKTGINSEALFQKMIERCEIVLVDYDRGTLSFKHKTFAEFFYARAIEKRQITPPLKGRAFNFYWMNTVFFYLGLLKDAPDVLREIGDLETISETERFFKILNMGNFLLAAYLSPYDVVIDEIAKTMVQAAQLYVDIVDSKIESGLSIFSRMDLLFLLQLVIRETYSFTFFKDALEDAALKINDSAYDEQIKSYAIFFLNVAYIELGGEESFDFLLASHGGDLPLEIALAIQHEAKDSIDRTGLMRKQDARVKRLLKNNNSLKASVRSWYHSPIRTSGSDYQNKMISAPQPKSKTK